MQQPTRTLSSSVNHDGEMEEPAPKKNPMNTEAEIIEPNQLLPDDIVLDIVARCGTIGDAIRCAATSKSLRRGILHEPFLQHLHGLLNNNGGGERGDDDGRPFNPTLLLGLYHQSGDPHLQPSFVPVSDGGATTNLPPSLAALPPPPNSDVGGCDFGPYLPVASRRSLLVLRRRCKSTSKDHLIEDHGLHPVELSVCNPTTGERRVLPPHDVHDMSLALLDVDPFVAPSSFKLLVAELSKSNNGASTLYVQIFSSDSDSEKRRGGWGPPLACPIVSRLRDSRSIKFGCSDGNTGRPCRPVVLGDTVSWLCNSRLGDRILTWRWRGGIARDRDREAWIADLPPEYRLGRPEKCLVVLPSPADAAAGAGSQALLGLIGIEAGEIEVWACEEERGGGSGSRREWKLRHRIQEAAIPRPMGLSSSRWLRGVELSWFCEGSGTLFLRPRDGTMSPLLFCLDTMEVSKLDAGECWQLNPEAEFCPYEIDLLSHMLFAMKQF